MRSGRGEELAYFCENLPHLAGDVLSSVICDLAADRNNSIEDDRATAAQIGFDADNISSCSAILNGLLQVAALLCFA